MTEDNSSPAVTAPLASTAEALEAARRIAGLAPSIDAKGAHSYSADAELVARALLASRAVPLAILEEAAQWLIARSYATGPGDTVSDLMAELVEQVRENTLKAAQKVGAGEPRPEGTPNPVVPLQSPSDAAGGWVIEGAWSDPAEPQYWAGSSLWMSDHMCALRFAREHDARQAASAMLDGMNIRICYHEWSPSEGLVAVPPSPQRDHPSPTLRAEMVEALREIVNALCSDAPTGPQKTIAGDDTIYHLDGQKMYHAINTARAILTKADAESANTDIQPIHIRHITEEP